MASCVLHISIIWLVVLIVELDGRHRFSVTGASTRRHDVSKLKGQYQKQMMGNIEIEYVHQLPDVSSSSDIKGVLFLAHGCSHSSTDWWPNSPSCPQCIGLPVEMSIVSEALSRNWIAVAVSSNNRQNKCWSQPDMDSVPYVLSELYKAHIQDSNTPLYLLGASSGGTFVGVLAQSRAFDIVKLQVTAINVQISGARMANDRTPPTAYTLMAKDHGSVYSIERRKQSLDTAKILVHKVLEQPISPGFFLEHGAVQSIEVSEKIHKALLAAQLIDSASFLLLEDPRRSDWRVALQKALPEVFPSQDSLIADESPLSELMNVAWAYHEITDDSLKETFDWFELQAQHNRNDHKF